MFNPVVTLLSIMQFGRIFVTLTEPSASTIEVNFDLYYWISSLRTSFDTRQKATTTN